MARVAAVEEPELVRPVSAAQSLMLHDGAVRLAWDMSNLKARGIPAANLHAVPRVEEETPRYDVALWLQSSGALLKACSRL